MRQRIFNAWVDRSFFRCRPRWFVPSGSVGSKKGEAELHTRRVFRRAGVLQPRYSETSTCACRCREHQSIYSWYGKIYRYDPYVLVQERSRKFADSKLCSGGINSATHHKDGDEGSRLGEKLAVAAEPADHGQPHENVVCPRDDVRIHVPQATAGGVETRANGTRRSHRHPQTKKANTL